MELTEMMVWPLVVVGIGASVAVFFAVRRARQRALWRSKRPINVRVSRDG